MIEDHLAHRIEIAVENRRGGAWGLRVADPGETLKIGEQHEQLALLPFEGELFRVLEDLLRNRRRQVFAQRAARKGPLARGARTGEHAETDQRNREGQRPARHRQGQQVDIDPAEQRGQARPQQQQPRYGQGKYHAIAVQPAHESARTNEGHGDKGNRPERQGGGEIPVERLPQHMCVDRHSGNFLLPLHPRDRGGETVGVEDAQPDQHMLARQQRREALCRSRIAKAAERIFDEHACCFAAWRRDGRRIGIGRNRVLDEAGEGNRPGIAEILQRHPGHRGRHRYLRPRARLIAIACGPVARDVVIIVANHRRTADQPVRCRAAPEFILIGNRIARRRCSPEIAPVARGIGIEHGDRGRDIRQHIGQPLLVLGRLDEEEIDADRFRPGPVRRLDRIGNDVAVYRAGLARIACGRVIIEQQHDIRIAFDLGGERICITVIGQSFETIEDRCFPADERRDQRGEQDQGDNRPFAPASLCA